MKLALGILALLTGTAEHRCPTDNALGTWTGNRDGKDCQYYHVVTQSQNEQKQHIFWDACGEKP